MSWNKSKSGGSAAVSASGRGGSRPHRPHRPPRRLLLPILLALLAAGGIAWWAWQSRGSAPIPERPRRSVAAIPDAGKKDVFVEIASPTNNTATTMREQNSPREKMWYDSDTNSAAYKIYHHRGPIITNSFALKTQSLSARTFKQTSDKIIGQLLSVKPGAFLFGEVKYDQRFVKRFLESLKTPIIIDPKDSEQVAVLKEAVIEARKELKNAYDRGEDIARIMTDTRKELKELGAYRAELQRQVNGIIRKDAKRFSEQDMADCLNAANKMLSDRGCQPLTMPGLMRHRLKVLHSQGIQEIEEE